MFKREKIKKVDFNQSRGVSKEEEEAIVLAYGLPRKILLKRNMFVWYYVNIRGISSSIIKQIPGLGINNRQRISIIANSPIYDQVAKDMGITRLEGWVANEEAEKIMVLLSKADKKAEFFEGTVQDLLFNKLVEEAKEKRKNNNEDL
jgi:hypothetical protein